MKYNCDHYLFRSSFKTKNPQHAGWYGKDLFLWRSKKLTKVSTCPDCSNSNQKTEEHPYGADWFDCPSCGGSFERFNQVQDAETGYCEGCAINQKKTS